METYLTLVELEAVLTEMFTSSELASYGWDTLSDADKTVYLNRATIKIESLYYRGIKASSDQTLKFPRIIDGVDVGVPDGVNQALAYLTMAENPDFSSDNRTNLQAQGIKSIKVEGSSETYSDSAMKSNYGKVVTDLVINTYMRRYVSNGVEGA